MPLTLSIQAELLLIRTSEVYLIPSLPTDKINALCDHLVVLLFTFVCEIVSTNARLQSLT